MLRSLAIASVLAAGTASAAGADPDFIRQTQAWQATRAANLKAPDGWLSLIGLEWLKEGANRVGSPTPDRTAVCRAAVSASR